MNEIFFNKTISKLTSLSVLSPDQIVFKNLQDYIYENIKNNIKKTSANKINISSFEIDEKHNLVLNIHDSKNIIEDFLSIFVFLDTIKDKIKDKMDDDKFIEFFHKMIKIYLYGYGLNIMNMTPLVKLIVDRINSIT